MPDSGTDAEGYTLWFRPTRRHKWRPIGTAKDQCGALMLMESSGERNGHWIVRRVGDPPDRNREGDHADERE